MTITGTQFALMSRSDLQDLHLFVKPDGLFEAPTHAMCAKSAVVKTRRPSWSRFNEDHHAPCPDCLARAERGDSPIPLTK